MNTERQISQENVENFKRVAEASNRRDIESELELLDRAVEWRPAFPVFLGGETKVYRGHDGIREMFREFYDVLDEIHVEYSDIRELGDQIIGIGRLQIRGGSSGIATESPFAVITDLRNGKAIRVRAYLDPEEALHEVGLEK